MNTREILRTVAGSNGSVVLEWDGKGLDVWLASDDREECDDRGGRAVSLTPDWARRAAAALNAAADKADADIQQWRDQLQRLRGELADAALRNAVRKAGLDG